MNRKNLDSAIFRAMCEHGVVRDGYKINIMNISNTAASDWATVMVDVIRPRCRKPCITWNLAIWLPGMNLNWAKSSFINR